VNNTLDGLRNRAAALFHTAHYGEVGTGNLEDTNAADHSKTPKKLQVGWPAETCIGCSVLLDTVLLSRSVEDG